MIIISGVTEGDEYLAAKRLERRLLDLWPDLARSRTDTVRMFVGLKMLQIPTIAISHSAMMARSVPR